MELSFLVSGKDASGQLQIDRIQAPSAALAAQGMASRGLKDVLLHEDETVAVCRALTAQEAAQLGIKVFPPPAPRVAYNTRFAKKTVGHLFARFTSPWLFGAFFVIFLTYSLLPLWVWISLLVITLGAFFYGSMTLPIVTYLDLLRALRLRNGVDALRLVDNFEKLLRKMKAYGAVGTIELASRRAQALALLGRQDETMQQLERLKSEINAPEWIYQLKRAEVHGVAQQFPEAIDASERALAAGAPPLRTLHLDLALRRALYGNDPIGARRALEAAKECVETEVTMLLEPIMEAMVLIAEKRPAEARTLLLKRPEELFLPVFEAWETLRKAMLVMALAPLGEAEEARRLFKEVEPQLIAMKDDHLLHYLRRALGD